MTTCNGHPQHELIPIVGGLEICECTASGWLAHLKGVVSEVRQMIDREGGYDAVRNRLHEAQKASRQRKAGEREDLLKAWHSAGIDRGAPPWDWWAA